MTKICGLLTTDRESWLNLSSSHIHKLTYGYVYRTIYRSHQSFIRELTGRYTYLFRGPTGWNQRSTCQVSTKEWYQGRVYYFVGLFFGSGVPRHEDITANFIENINSYRLLSLSFMTHPRLREHSMISWRYLRLEEMWPLERSLISFNRWAHWHWYRLVAAFGKYCSRCVVKCSPTLYD